MSCRSPLLAIPTELGTYKVLSAWHPEDQYKYPGSISIPCGKCAECRLTKSKEWADRCILELDHCKKAIFVTLTYDEGHVPRLFLQQSGQTIMTLKKRDVQLFLKRLRKKLDGDYLCRFLCAGEYGETNQRPHYHLIIFGLGTNDLIELARKDRKSDEHGLKFIKMNELGQPYYRSDWLWSLWEKGIVNVCEVSWKTCAYVARYTMKKWKSDADENELIYRDPEFLTMSRRPGLGMFFPIDHPEAFDSNVFYFNDQDGSVQVRTPARLLDVLEKVDPDLYLETKKERYERSYFNTLNKLSFTDLSFEEYKDLENENKEKSYKLLDSFNRSDL